MKSPFTNLRISGRAVLDLLIETIYLAVVFLVPIWFANLFPTYNIFEFNKSILFEILIWLLLFFTLVKVIFYSPQSNLPVRPFFKKYWLVPTIFIIGLSLTLFSSISPIRSFYGTIERQQGLLSYLFYFLWFILVSFNILISTKEKTAISEQAIPKKIKRIIIAAVLSSSLVAVYGISQILNIDFIVWPEQPYLTRRALSSLGQPNFLASWLLLVIPLSIYLFINSRHRWAKLVWLLVLISQIFCLFFTGSRGGLVALFLTSFIFLIYLFISASWSRQKKLLISLLFMILTVVSLFFLDYFSGGRWRELKNHDYGSLGARTSFYQAAADAIIKQPFFGYGLENSKEIFIKYYSPDWGVYGDINQSPDRAHNLFLDIFLTTGFFGFLLFVAFYYFFFDLARSNIHQKKMSDLSLVLLLGAVAYLFSLFFSFAIIAGEIYFWLFLALLVVINVSEKTDWRTETSKFLEGVGPFRLQSILKIVVIIFLAVVIFWQVNQAVQSLIADHYFNEVYVSWSNNDYTSVLTAASYLAAYQTNPINRWSYESFLGEKLSNIYPFLPKSQLKIVVGKKLEELNKSLPDQYYKNLLVKADINGVLGNFSVGRSYTTRLIDLTPHWPLVYLSAGKIAFAAGNFKEALLAYHLAALNLPSASDSRLNAEHHQGVLDYQYFINNNIGDIYQAQKNYLTAEKYYNLAYESNPGDFTLLKKISDTYYRRGDLTGSIKYSLHGLARNPSDYHWSLALALLYHELGDKSQALVYIKRALILAPGNSDLEMLEKEFSK